MKNRSHTIETTLNLSGNEEGVIVACGGLTGGYTLYIKNNQVHYDYNAYNERTYSIVSDPLPKGTADIKFTFKKTGTGAGEGSLSVNGKSTAAVAMEKMHLSTFSLSETFDVGVDCGSPVSVNYGGKDTHFPFSGDIDNITIALMDVDAKK